MSKIAKKGRAHVTNTKDEQAQDLLGGLVSRRAKIQELSYAILTFLKQKKLTASLRGTDMEIGTYLVGTAFSLWRAIFLIDARRQAEPIFDTAMKFFERVIS